MVRSRSVYATFQEKSVTRRKKTLGVVEVNSRIGPFGGSGGLG